MEWPDAQKEAARQLGYEQKWLLVCQLREKSTAQSKTAAEMIASLKEKFSLSQLEHLVISLTREPVAWMNDFVKNDGVKLLVAIMQENMSKDKSVTISLQFFFVILMKCIIGKRTKIFRRLHSVF